MSENDAPPPLAAEDLPRLFVHAIGGVFGSLGRALICVDSHFRVMHASEGLDAIAGPGASQEIVGASAERILGTGHFGTEGGLRRALEGGEKREGWGATLRVGERPPRIVSLTAAPVGQIQSPLCDTRVSYLLVLRASEDASEAESAPPTYFSGMVGRSEAMLRLFRMILNLAESESTVLLSGESGTGKELVARALHLQSPRRAGPFVAVNCGALPGELLESELFGHVRGAFTGATRDRVGRFELAAGGTLFLDEVGDLSLPLQVKLLRVLQERTYERVGESDSRTANARIIGATNRDLQREVMEGRFRGDLYYRLRVVPIHIPPLRERREDIEPLAQHLLTRVSARTGRSLRLAPDVLRVFLRHAWPGNVRELENALEYAVAVSRGQTIHDGDLPGEVRAGSEPPTAGAPAGGAIPPTPAPAPWPDGAPRAETNPAPAAPAPSPASALSAERQRLQEALAAHRWNRAEAARALGMSRTTLWRRLRELGLSDPA